MVSCTASPVIAREGTVWVVRDGTVSPDERHDQSGTDGLPPITWSPTAPGIPLGVVSQQSISRDEASARMTLGGIEIRRVRLRDILQVARIQRRAFPPRLAYPIATLLTLSFLPIVQFVVAVQGRHVLGCAIGDRSGLDARVINIAVDPPARRLGVGAALLFELETRLSGGDMVLMVQRENTDAHALYLRVGYVDVGTAIDYYGRGRHGIWMRKHRPTRFPGRASDSNATPVL